MPLYEYRCTACDRLTEKRQKFSDPEITECPHCNGRLERTITAPAVQFKGGGWFADGYGSKKAVAGGSGESPSTASESKSADPAKRSTSETGTASTSAATTTPKAPAASAPSGTNSTSSK